MKARFCELLGYNMPTYAGMIEKARDAGTPEEYHFAATIIRRARNLTRLGRANALRDLRDATGRAGRT